MTISCLLSATLRPRACAVLRFSLHEPWPTTRAPESSSAAASLLSSQDASSPLKLPAGQAPVLFSYLTVTAAAVRARRVDRGAVARPPPAGADTALSALLSRLRSVLGARCCRVAASSSFVLPADAWIDLEAAEDAIHRAEAAVSQRAWARGWGPSSSRLFTARRGFLIRKDLPWAEEQRRRLEEIQHLARLSATRPSRSASAARNSLPANASRENSSIWHRTEREATRFSCSSSSPRKQRRGPAGLRDAAPTTRDELGATPTPELRELQERYSSESGCDAR